MKILKEYWVYILIFICCIALRGNFPLVEVKGDSMDNTLYNGEALVTTKHYNLKKGDIVIAHNENYENNNKDLVKRVIGEAGDKIKIEKGNLYVNGELQEENYIKEPMKDNIKSYENGYFYRSSDLSIINDDDILLETEVPEGKLFLMGDNRNISGDSRLFGFFDKKTDIYTKVVFPTRIKNSYITVTIYTLIIFIFGYSFIIEKRNRNDK